MRVFSIVGLTALAAMGVEFAHAQYSGCTWVRPQEHLNDVPPGCPSLSAPQPLTREGAIKKDILGFSPEMTKDEFEIKLRSADVKSFENFQKWDGIRYELTKEFSPNVVRNIILNFSSGTPPAEMISQVTEQFNVSPVKANWSAEIRRAVEGEYCGRGINLCYGGLIAMWRLDEKLGLYLHLNSPAAGGRPNQYYLSLASDHVAKLEAFAVKQRRDEMNAKSRAINPQQRF